MSYIYSLLSIWVFVLLGVEGIKAFRANPYFAYVRNTLERLEKHRQLTIGIQCQHISNTDMELPPGHSPLHHCPHT